MWRISPFAHLIGPAMMTSALLTIPAMAAPTFQQTNLASDIPGLAAVTDPNLKNPWGMSFSATSPFWVSNQGSNNSTLYNGAGTPQALVVTVPTTGAGPQGPTGQVFNGGSNFALTPGNPARFIFATLSGEIAGWNPAVSPTTAVVQFAATDRAVYTGLANATVGGSDFLYAADFGNGKIDVFNSSFQKTTLAGSFTDPNVPAGYSPYNIQNINGKLYVEYAKVDPVTRRASEDLNQGLVDVFDLNGNLTQRLVTNTNLSSPWGVTLAPSGFGAFGGALLVGNFGDGRINAFDPITGAFLGALSDALGQPIENDGLWAIKFRDAASGFDPNALFFVAGINDEADGLFGRITAVPEPSTYLLLSIGIGLVAIRSRWTARKSDS